MQEASPGVRQKHVLNAGEMSAGFKRVCVFALLRWGDTWFCTFVLNRWHIIRILSDVKLNCEALLCGGRHDVLIQPIQAASHEDIFFQGTILSSLSMRHLSTGHQESSKTKTPSFFLNNIKNKQQQLFSLKMMTLTMLHVSTGYRTSNSLWVHPQIIASQNSQPNNTKDQLASKCKAIIHSGD